MARRLKSRFGAGCSFVRVIVAQPGQGTMYVLWGTPGEKRPAQTSINLPSVPFPFQAAEYLFPCFILRPRGRH